MKLLDNEFIEQLCQNAVPKSSAWQNFKMHILITIVEVLTLFPLHLFLLLF